MNHQSQHNSQRSRDHRIPSSQTHPINGASSAALKGATSAFGTHPNAPHPVTTARKDDGARAAAAAAGSARHDRQVSRSDAEVPSTRLSVKDQIQSLEKTFSNTSLQPPSTSESARSQRPRPPPVKSPSYIAAQLASLRSPVSDTAKAPSATPKPAVATKQENRDREAQHSPQSEAESDVSPARPVIVTPKPVRVFSGPHALRNFQQSGTSPGIGQAEGASQMSSSPSHALEAAMGAFARSPSRPASRAPSLSAQSTRSRSSSIVSRPRVSLDAGSRQLREQRMPSLSSLSMPKERPASTQLPKTSPLTSMTHESGTQIKRPMSVKHEPSFMYAHLHEMPRVLDQKTGLTESALADAMVAGSLASSRAPSPHKQTVRPPPPQPRRSSKPRGLFGRNESGNSRNPSPPKKGILKKTLRKAAASSDEEEADPLRRGRRHLVRRHHRKHHEGDRKKWRDEVTPRQRKRYEGVWAANRGLFMPVGTSYSPDTREERSNSDLVVNMVVRDIWKRSRLPDDVLEEVWDLVDRNGIGALGRDEFVVGMWLIDQRLRGRLQVKNKIKY